MLISCLFPQLVVAKVTYIVNLMILLFSQRCLSNEIINDLVTEHFQEQWDSVFSAMETKFPDAYPAYIFRNVVRLKKLVDAMP